MALISLQNLQSKIKSHLGPSLLSVQAITLGMRRTRVSPRFPDPSGLETVQVAVPFPADIARPLLLLGQVSESHDSVSFVATLQRTRIPGGEIQPLGWQQLRP